MLESERIEIQCKGLSKTSALSEFVTDRRFENPRYDILPRMSARRHGCLATLLKFLLLCVIVFYGAVGVTNPWAFRIGGRWTPLLYWSGNGKLVTKTGTYPLYVMFYPSAHFSRLHLDGLRPTGGLQGTGSLCTSPGVVEALKLGGTIYGGWSSADDALMQFRLLEIRVFNVGQQQGLLRSLRAMAWVRTGDGRSRPSQQQIPLRPENRTRLNYSRLGKLLRLQGCVLERDCPTAVARQLSNGSDVAD